MASDQNEDVRWKQRFQNYNKALNQLRKFFDKRESLNELEEQGLIKSFEYTYELAWNTIKDFYEDQGEANIQGSKDAFRLAYKRGLIKDGQLWMDMVEDRKLTVHTYNKETSTSVSERILSSYYQSFRSLADRLESYRSGNQLNIK
ncbi:MAG: nucleotidyltransferase substrate binding protein [Cyclobacteriaceae bacterium]